MAWTSQDTAQTVANGGGLISSILGGRAQGQAIKKAGTTLANQYNLNADRILGVGDRAADSGLAASNAAASGVGDAVNSGQKTISDTTNMGVGRIDDSLQGLAPIMGLAQKGTDAINTGFDSADSGLQFLLDQGNKQINNNTALSGIIGGNTARRLDEFGQGTAQQYRSNWLNDQLKLVQQGQSAIGQNTAGQTTNANLLANAGNNIANMGVAGAKTQGDYGVAGTNTANTFRTNAMNGAVDQWNGAAGATAGSQLGSASNFANTLNGAVGSGGGLLTDILKMAGG